MEEEEEEDEEEKQEEYAIITGENRDSQTTAHRAASPVSYMSGPLSTNHRRWAW